MPIAFYRRLFAAVSFCFVLSAVAFGQLAPPADSGLIRLTEKQAKDFAVAVAEIARQGNIAVIAESAPLPLRIAAAKVKSLTEQALPLKEMATRLADAYDYQVVYPERGQSGARRERAKVLVFQKRYTHGRDLPEVTPVECLKALTSICRLIDSQGP